MDFAQKALETYTPRIAQVYLNPNHVVDAPKAEAAEYYYVSNIPLKTCTMASYQAPSFGWKANMLYPSKIPISGNYGAINAAAPTSGVFTGIPSGCSPSGVHGSPF